MAEVLLFVPIDRLEPATGARTGAPRVLAIRTNTVLQDAVLQERLLDALRREYASWRRDEVGAAAEPFRCRRASCGASCRQNCRLPSRWPRLAASLRALVPSRAMRRKLPAAVPVELPLAGRRRAF